MPTIVKYILVFFISMVPIIELRGAVPIGVTYFGLIIKKRLCKVYIALIDVGRAPRFIMNF